jgi:hypothetical protein
MTKLEISCGLDVLERWENLSDETKRILGTDRQSIDFMRVMWERDFYKQVAEVLNT